MIGFQHFGAGARFFVPRLQLTGDGHQSVHHVPRARHPEGEFFAGLAVADLQTERGVEAALDLLRDEGEIDVEVR
ncbi:hypothetical protein [Streptomyces sp. TRM49041]|uniref:hypothetical protein n=1 Tax=Streptomyces sp. TRM49041 TaxID=2603216 RepID=UPI0011EC1EB8|nr:hypothetical protein [Streptomyces sp. TRM49041]